jgi:hypothetical protein
MMTYVETRFCPPTNVRMYLIIIRIMKQIHRFNYLGCDVSYCCIEGMDIKLSKVQRMFETIRRKLKSKALKQHQMKCYKVMAILT